MARTAAIAERLWNDTVTDLNSMQLKVILPD
jgi:hypothetical protein